MVISTNRSIYDTSSNILDDIGFRKVYSGDLLDSSYFALNTTGRKTDIANNRFSNFKILNKFGKLQGYSESQTIQNFILGELNQLSIEDRYFRSDPKFQFIFIDTSSDNLEQAKSSELEDIITDECMKFCESHGFIDTLNDCLYRVEQDFELLKKIQVELGYFYDDEEELDNEPHVIIEAKVNTSREKAESNYDEWLDWFIESVPRSIRKFFILTVDRE